MKNNYLRNQVGLSLLTVLSGVAVSAADPIPRGPNIESIAGVCKVGPFEQISKAGRYNQHCQTLTDGEKCLGLIKAYMSDEGVLSEIQDDYYNRKMSYCLDIFKAEFKLTTGSDQDGD